MPAVSIPITVLRRSNFESGRRPIIEFFQILIRLICFGTCANQTMRFKRAGYILDIIWQTACLGLTQSWLKAMLNSLVARRWFRPQTQWWLRCEALKIWLKLDDCLWLDPPWFNKWFSLVLVFKAIRPLHCFIIVF